MKEEIKDLIKLLNEYKIREKNGEDKFYPEDIIIIDELWQLLDYITNLQEENKDLKEYRESYRKELDFWRIQFSNKEEIINKAIEYIKEDIYVEPKELYGLVDGEHLLNILKGE